MKNFDTARAERNNVSVEDRTFQLGGETFIARTTVRPEALAKWDGIDSDMSASDILVATDETILALIENGDDAHARYTALRAREDDPVGLEDLVDVGKWLVEVQTGRPIEAPSDSTTSPSTPGTTSTVVPSSPDTPEAQAA